MAAADVLKNLGFIEGETTEMQALSDEMGLSANGNPHKVLAVFTKDDVTGVIEQNISEDEAGGVVSITKHPAVLILESPRGRVCVSNHDDPENKGLIEHVTAELAGLK